MLASAQQLYREVRAAHERIYKAMQELHGLLPSLSTKEATDTIYALREMETLLDDSRKEVKRVKNITEKLVCIKWTLDGIGGTISTDYCTGSPDNKICAKMPDANKPEERADYEALMSYLGIDPQLWDNGEVMTEKGLEDTKVVNIHWPGFQDYCNRLIAAGYQLPPGIDKDKTYTLYSVSIRKKKGVDQ